MLSTGPPRRTRYRGYVVGSSQPASMRGQVIWTVKILGIQTPAEEGETLPVRRKYRVDFDQKDVLGWIYPSAAVTFELRPAGKEQLLVATNLSLMEKSERGDTTGQQETRTTGQQENRR